MADDGWGVRVDERTIKIQKICGKRWVRRDRFEVVNIVTEPRCGAVPVQD